MDIYGEIVLDHFKHPRHSGILDHADFQAEDANTLCGDTVKISVKAGSDGVIGDFGFEGDGCAISIASTSLLGENLIGMKLDDVVAMKNEQVLEMLGIPISPGRMKCALLGYSCLKKAVTLYQSQETPNATEEK